MHYRIFNKSTKQPESGHFVYQDGVIYSWLGQMPVNDPDLVVEPYTGFRDINGKMIYLHDILEFIPFQHKVSVQWKDGGFKCVTRKGDFEMAMQLEGTSKYTIVGHL